MRPHRARSRRLVRILFLAFGAAAAPGASAQVFKCTDAEGHVTYQQEPCPTHQKGGKVDLLDAVTARESPEREAQWAAAAREGSLRNGMPRAWVRKVLGDPAEMRPGRIEENALEVWTFPAVDGRRMRVGFVGGNVAWFRNEPATAKAETPPPAAPAAPQAPGGTQNPVATQASVVPQAAVAPQAPAEPPIPAAAVPPQAPLPPVATQRPLVPQPPALPQLPPVSPPGAAAANPATVPSPAPSRTISLRDTIVAGTPCSDVFARLGPPDRREVREKPALGGAGVETRYFYEPGPADPNSRMTVVCVGGKVATVDRSRP